jgi:hypothetical protein
MAAATPGDNPHDNYDPAFDRNGDGAHDKAENDERAKAKENDGNEVGPIGAPQPKPEPT